MGLSKTIIWGDYMELNEIFEEIRDLWLNEDNVDSKLSQQDIDSLISCEKHIENPEKIKRNFDIDLTQKRFSMMLFANDFPDIKFKMDIRISTIAPENFSVVLTLLNVYKNICLYRCNGPHNEPNNTLHTEHHTHTLRINDLIDNRLSQPDYREKANYHSLTGAISYFVTKCNIIGIENILPRELGNINQIGLEEI